MQFVTASLKAHSGKADQSATSPRFVMNGAILYDADRRVIAAYKAGLWHAERCVFISIDFESPVALHFTNAQVHEEERFGPLDQVRIINSSVWGFNGKPDVIANLDARLDIWHIVERPAVAMSEFTIS